MTPDRHDGGVPAVGYASLAALLPMPIIVFDKSERVVSVNREASTVLRVDASSAVGQHVVDLLANDDNRLTLLELLDELRQESQLRPDGAAATLPRDVRLRRADGSDMHADVVALALSDSDRAFAIRPPSRPSIDGASPPPVAHDGLTGLPTREVLLEQLRSALGRLERHDGIVAVVFIDLDQMKAVNDSLGHHAGDLMLCDIAARLRATIRAGDTVARFGGDEFVVLLHDLTDDAEVDYVVRRLQGVIEQPLLTGGHRIDVTASIGVAVARSPETSADALIREADVAMYDSKRSRQGPVRFDERLREQARERVRLEADLRQGLNNGEVRAYFQPIVRPDGSVAGAEALARWLHPERGVITPVAFVPLAEEAGLIHQVGSAVLRDACAAVASWRSRPGGEHMYVTVNCSARQIARPGLVRDIVHALTAADLPPDALLIEVTETVLISDAELAHAVLSDLAAARIRVALDDFGTGYSSLTHLRDFPVDIVKVDRSFVSRMMGNPTDMAIVQALIELCGALGVLVCAEGVEHRGQAEVLASLQCPLGQGEYWSPPLTAAEFAQFIDGRTPDSTRTDGAR